jgi:hypothetical protein
MLHPRRYRLTTFLLLAAYLAANTLSGLWHDHAEPPGATTACCRHSDHEHAAGEHGASDLADVGSAPVDGAAVHDDDCTVCRFVGQRVLPVASAPLGTWTELSVELSLVHAWQPVVTTVRTTHSRAPPLAG